MSKRFADPGTPLEHIDVGAPLGPLARAFAIGKPRRYETPLYFPSRRALAFGDAVVGMPDGSLRIWVQGRVDPAWYARTLPAHAASRWRRSTSPTSSSPTGRP